MVDAVLSAGEETYRLQKLEPSGTVIAPQHVLFKGRPNGLAVDSTGAFYVSNEISASAIRKYNAAATEQIGEIKGTDISGLAVDAADHLFVATRSFEYVPSITNIGEYDSSGAILRRFAYGESANSVAPYQSANGDIYVSEGGNLSEGSRVRHLDFPPPGPVIVPQPCKTTFLGNSKATLTADINPEGKATTYHFEYLTEAQSRSRRLLQPGSQKHPRERIDRLRLRAAPGKRPGPPWCPKPNTTAAWWRPTPTPRGA